MMETKVTSKYQTTIPKEVREFLNVESGKDVEWNIVKSIVVITTKRKMEHPVKFLTSQIKMNIDAVKLIKESREDFR